MGTTFENTISTRNSAQATKSLKLTPPDNHLPSAWFLGPNAENLDVFENLIKTAMAMHADARKDYEKNDPDMASGRGPEFERTCEVMYDNLAHIMRELRGSIPLSSHRNQSHMYWDITMPGAAGYFAGMLFNQNNVAAEASPITTAMEINVAKELCTMLGFDLGAKIKPWGHITCDGSVANLESMWAARNLKYMPVALARAIRQMPELFGATKYMIEKPDGTDAFLLDLDTWELLNIDIDEALRMRQALVSDYDVDEAAVQKAIDTYSWQAMGAAAFEREVLHGAVSPAPAILVPATAHYSWQKAGTILGLGTNSVISVPVDLEGRVLISELRKTLQKCLDEHRPVIQVVAVIGSTEESAVDPLKDILRLRKQFAKLGLTFALHADAAWGGYFASTLRDPPKSVLKKPVTARDKEHTGFDDLPASSFSKHVRTQFECLGEVDTVTVDPHKGGYIPYPAGALCYRNEEMIYQVAYTSPVVFHDGSAPTVGVYGVEGSKPGAAAVGVTLSHATIPPNRLGYGRILGRCIFNSKRYYAAVTTLAKPSDEFIVVPFKRLPAERDGGTKKEIETQRQLIFNKFTQISNDALRKVLDDDKDLLKLFTRLGPDLTVFAYAFNFKVKGKLNKDIDLMNKFNNKLFDLMSIQEPGGEGELPHQELFVTSSQFDPGKYGAHFVDSFAERAGLTPDEKTPIRFLISTMQNPFVTATADGNFIPTLMKVLRRNIETARTHIISKYSLDEEQD